MPYPNINFNPLFQNLSIIFIGVGAAPAITHFKLDKSAFSNSGKSDIILKIVAAPKRSVVFSFSITSNVNLGSNCLLIIILPPQCNNGKVSKFHPPVWYSGRIIKALS
ncbi:hypothetical protein SDC9_201717 [bioreactor metagenome]|uniref:Uncharacterized protein n=1 Tax=bioreactor metagenome TaxID=1076179 RepID=A0A645IRQ5_9ZZZZ